MSKIFSLPVSIAPIIALFIGGIATIISGYPVWSYVLWGLAFIWLLISLIRSKKTEDSSGLTQNISQSQAGEDIIQVQGDYIVNNIFIIEDERPLMEIRRKKYG